MRQCFLLVACSLISLVLYSPSAANDEPSTDKSGQDTAEQICKPSITVYLTLKKMLADNKHQTLSVELFEQESGEKKRIEGGSMGDLFIEIVPYLIANSEPETPQDKEEEERLNQEHPDAAITDLVIRLSTAPALDVAETLNRYYKNEVSEDNKNAAPKISAVVLNNSLIVSTSSQAQMNQVKTMVSSLDAQPPMFKAKFILGRKEKDGSVTYISKPRILTMENLAGRLHVGQIPNFEESGEGYSIEVTMRQTRMK